MDTMFRIEALQKKPESFYRIVSWFPSFPFRFTRVADFGQIGHGGYISAFHSDKAFSSVGLAPLIAHVGFPAPAILAVWITFNESIGALLIGCGLFTRIAAVSAALGMAGALYTSLRLGEDWLRAALYLIVFIALTLTGAGKFSIDRALQTRKSNRRARKTSLSTS